MAERNQGWIVFCKNNYKEIKSKFEKVKYQASSVFGKGLTNSETLELMLDFVLSRQEEWITFLSQKAKEKEVK